VTTRRASCAAAAAGLMRFNSVEYFVFLVVVVGAFWAIRPARRPLLLVLASLVFYGVREWRYVPLLVGTVLLTYATARAMPTAPPRRRRLLAGSTIVALCAVLGAFKFISASASSSSFVIDQPLSFVVPIGLSFYVFQAIAYTVDVYRRDVEPEQDLVHYGTYVSFFPHLLAGPIIRYRRFAPQLVSMRREPRRIDLVEGAELLFIGLFKKVAVADVLLGTVIEQGREFFLDETQMTTVNLLLTAGIALLGGYFDIAGYIDMARGSAKLLGIDMPRNFAQPLTQSRDLTDFWRRWQTTIMAWLRDYLYRPLRGSTRSRARTFGAILATFLVAGLWHGLDLGWLVWGTATAAILMGERAWAQRRVRQGRPAKRRRTGWARALGPLYVFVCLVITAPWIAGQGASGALLLYRGLLSGGLWADWNTALFLAYGLAVLVLADRHERLRRRPGTVASTGVVIGRTVAASLMVVALVVFSGSAPQDFVYFRF
jgi:D-alanyl-lipoteichoic acid acyltransferase DltB (MBOAT superfamily)